MKKFLKISGSIVGGFFALGIMAAACSDEEVTQEKTEPKVEQVEKVEKKEEVKVDQKKAVKDFEKKALSLDEHFVVLWDEVEKALEANDGYAAYGASQNAHSELKRVWQASSKLEVPKGLDKEVTESLENAQENLELAFFMKMEGIEALQTFLDSQKPSDLQEFKSNASSSQSYTLQAMSSIIQAKSLVGLPIE